MKTKQSQKPIIGGIITVVCLSMLMACGNKNNDLQHFYGEENEPSKTGKIRLSIFGSGEKDLSYSVFDSLKIVSGDIVIQDLTKGLDLRGNGELGLVWPAKTIPYTIDNSINDDQLEIIKKAIDHWTEKTQVQYVPKKNADINYVTFIKARKASVSSSFVGMQGGQQLIWLGTETGLSVAIHEMGHAAGLWHEQSRPDRDQYITVNFNNIKSKNRFNFDIMGSAIGSYDFNSRMHYDPYSFSRNGKPTIEAKDPANIIVSNGLLSSGDIAAVAILYKDK